MRGCEYMHVHFRACVYEHMYIPRAPYVIQCDQPGRIAPSNLRNVIKDPPRRGQYPRMWMQLCVSRINKHRAIALRSHDAAA